MTVEGIEVNNPGVATETQPAIAVPRNKNGNIDWFRIKDDPEFLTATIEAEAQRFVTDGAHLSQSSLARAGMTSLTHAISEYYPGGLVALKEKLNVAQRIPNDYSKVVEVDEFGVPRDQRGRMFLAVLKDKPEQLMPTVEAEARRLMTEGVEITGNGLSAHGFSGFVAQIQSYYPGGMVALREKLGTPIEQRPNGYWHDPANIEIEARQLAEQGNNLTQNELKGLGMGTLSQAAREHYPGGLRQLRINLGLTNPIRHPKGKWQTTEAIETEVEEFLGQGNELTQDNLNKAGLSSLVAAIRKSYPNGLAGIREHFGLPSPSRPAGYWQDLANIEAEARKLIEDGKPLTQPALYEAGLSSLSDAVRKYYPGGLNQLRVNLGLEVRKRDIGYWTKERIEQEARDFLAEGGNLSGNALTRAGKGALLGAIASRYPGTMRQLKINLGIEPGSKPEGFWTAENIGAEAHEFFQTEGDLRHPLLKKQGRSDLATAITSKYPGGMTQLKIDLGLELNRRDNYWTPEKVEEEAKEFVRQHGGITQRLLGEAGRHDLSGAISGHYPGKFGKLKEALGLEATKPPGYWTPERIEQEAREFYQATGALTQTELVRLGRSDLIHAILTYPGGTFALRNKLGIEAVQKPAGFWSAQTIEEEARRILEEEGRFTSKLLVERGKTGLAAAIPKHYPDGMSGLRETLGLPSNQRPTGYWQDIENIEAEARKLLDRGITISQRTIVQAGVSSLNGAISKYYPGGMAGLKEKLGIISALQSTITPDEATEQLQKLLEG